MKVSTKVSYCIVFAVQLTTLPAAKIMPHRITGRSVNTELETACKENRHVPIEAYYIDLLF
jgi:ribosomal protein S18